MNSSPIRDAVLRMHYILLLLDPENSTGNSATARWDAWHEAVKWYEATLPQVSPSPEDQARPPLDVHFDPDQVDVRGMRAMAHVLLGLEQTKRMEYELATREFDQAIALHPKSAEGYFYRAYVLSHTKDGYVQSQADFKKAAMLDTGAFRDAANRQIVPPSVSSVK